MTDFYNVIYLYTMLFVLNILKLLKKKKGSLDIAIPEVLIVLAANKSPSGFTYTM